MISKLSFVILSGTVLVNTAGSESESHRKENIKPIMNKNIPIGLVGVFSVNQFLKFTLIFLMKKLRTEKIDNDNILQYT